MIHWIRFISLSFFSMSFVFSLSASEVLQKEISFFVDHPATDVVGICGDITHSPIQIKSTLKGYVLTKPFSVEVPLSQIKSGDNGRDDHIRQILGAPEISSVEATIESVTLSGTGYSAQGKLKIKGVVKEFQAALSVTPQDKDVIQVQGKTTVLFSDYSLENPSLLFWKAKDQIEVRFLFLIRAK